MTAATEVTQYPIWSIARPWCYTPNIACTNVPTPTIMSVIRHHSMTDRPAPTIISVAGAQVLISTASSRRFRPRRSTGTEGDFAFCRSQVLSAKFPAEYGMRGASQLRFIGIPLVTWQGLTTGGAKVGTCDCPGERPFNFEPRMPARRIALLVPGDS